MDVRQVLTDHGFPEADGDECVELELALFRLLYETTSLGSRAVTAEGTK
ncbi:MAG: hypothetical protein ACRDZ3_20780 [Acidimicrobiia bacterium]